MISFILFVSLTTSLLGQSNQKCESDWRKVFDSYLFYHDTVDYYYGFNMFFSYKNELCVMDTLGFINFLITNYVMLNDSNIVSSPLAFNTNYKPKYYNDTTIGKPNLSSHIDTRGFSPTVYISRSIIAMYYVNALFESSFKFRQRIQLNYKGQKIGVQEADKWEFPMKRSLNIMYEVDKMQELNKAVRIFLRWHRKLQKHGLKRLKEKEISPFLHTNFKWD